MFDLKSTAWGLWWVPLLLGWALLFAGDARAVPLVFIENYTDPVTQKRYNVVTIQQVDDESAWAAAHSPDLRIHSTYADKLMKYLEKWVPEAYVALEIIPRDGTIYKALFGVESPLDGRSTLMFVCDENDLSKIHSFVRFMPGGNVGSREELAMQLRVPGLQLSTAEPQLHQGPWGSFYFGGFGEIKHFIQLQPEPNFFSVMAMQIFQMGFFSKPYQDPETGGRGILVPRYYFIETHGAGRRYFRRTFGFRPLENDLGVAQISEAVVNTRPETMENLRVDSGLDQGADFKHFMSVDILRLLSTSTSQSLAHSSNHGRVLPSDSFRYTKVQWEVPDNFAVPNTFPSDCEAKLAKRVPFYSVVE